MSAPTLSPGLLWCPCCGTETVDADTHLCRSCRDVVEPEAAPEPVAKPREVAGFNALFSTGRPL